MVAQMVAHEHEEEAAAHAHAHPEAPAAYDAHRLSSNLEQHFGDTPEVAPLESGTRFAVPCFFTTCPQPEEAAWLAAGDDEATAAELWRTLFAPEEVTHFREFVGRWHALLAADR